MFCPQKFFFPQLLPVWDFFSPPRIFFSPAEALLGRVTKTMMPTCSLQYCLQRCLKPMQIYAAKYEPDFLNNPKGAVYGYYVYFDKSYGIHNLPLLKKIKHTCKHYSTILRYLADSWRYGGHPCHQI